MQASDSLYKTVFLPKVRIEPIRMRAYRREFAAWGKAGNKGSFAEWIRATLDASLRETELPELPRSSRW